MPSFALVAIFLAGAGAIWLAGIVLSDATDALDARLGLGSALGGLILLAFATNLPEVAITVTAAIRGNLDLAVGNLVGGVAIQTLVLALLDGASRDRRPLTYVVGSLVLVIEAAMVVATMVAAIMATQLPASKSVAGISPGSIVIVLLWIAGLLVVNASRRGIPWHIEAPEARSGRTPVDRAKGKGAQPYSKRSTTSVALLFAGAAVLTLLAGVAIEESGNELASRVGLTGAVFGATVLAASTALPEVSTGLAAVKLGDNQLAFSDIFGGNAFLPVLFLLADAVAGHPALPQAKASDVWMAGLGVSLTAVYIVGLVMRPGRRIWRLGPDSLLAVVLYALGIAGLVMIGG